MTSMCEICCNKFTKTVRKPVTCESCKLCACMDCIKKVVTTQKSLDPYCMGCKTEYTEVFLDATFTKTYIKKNRETVMLDIEKRLLPETAIYLESLKTGKKTSIIRKCVASNCNGFLNSEYVCITCSKSVCHKCHIEKTDNHVCNTHDVESVKLILKDSKTCPWCCAMIFKIDGCDLMYCTMCNVSFSWSTGEEMKNVQYNHNPHYLNQLRLKNNGVVPRAPGDVYIPNDEIMIFVATFQNWDYRIPYVGSSLPISLERLLNYNIIRYADNYMRDNRDLRIDFIQNAMSEIEWGRMLIKRDTWRRYVMEQKKISESTLHYILSILKKMIESKERDTIIEMLDNMVIGMDTFNDSIIKLRTKFSMRVSPKLDLFDIDKFKYQGRW